VAPPLLAPTRDQLIALVITPGFYLHQVEVTDQIYNKFIATKKKKWRPVVKYSDFPKLSEFI